MFSPPEGTRSFVPGARKIRMSLNLILRQGGEGAGPRQRRLIRLASPDVVEEVAGLVDEIVTEERRRMIEYRRTY